MKSHKDILEEQLKISEAIGFSKLAWELHKKKIYKSIELAARQAFEAAGKREVNTSADGMKAHNYNNFEDYLKDLENE